MQNVQFGSEIKNGKKACQKSFFVFKPRKACQIDNRGKKTVSDLSSLVKNFEFFDVRTTGMHTIITGYSCVIFVDLTSYIYLNIVAENSSRNNAVVEIVILFFCFFVNSSGSTLGREIQLVIEWQCANL